MSHLTIETLARLVDEPPTPVETAHLEACGACRTELEDLRADAAALAALPPLEPPEGEWDAVAARLAAEGLIRQRGVRAGWGAALLRVAAAVALLAVGGIAGVQLWGERPPATVARTEVRPEPLTGGPAPAPVTLPSEQAPVEVARRPEASPPAEAAAVPALRANPRLALFLAGREPGSYEEAMQLYRETEGLYLDALTRMAELSGGGEAGDPYARLAALEAITSITRAALGQAPADPVLNGYHVTALAQRDATLRQIAARATDSWF